MNPSSANRRYQGLFPDVPTTFSVDGDERWLALINIENRQSGLLAAVALMREGGIIACEAPRHPLPPQHPASRALPIETARRLDALALRWGR